MSARSLFAARALVDELKEGVRLTIESGVVQQVEIGVAARSGDEVVPGSLLIPGLVDLQVNGALGYAFDDPDPEHRKQAVGYHLDRGTTSLLATLVSAPLDELNRSIEQLVPDVSEMGPVLGIHLEGPFLSGDKAGAHAAQWLCDPQPAVLAGLLGRAQKTLRMLTLAPELPGACEAIERLTAAGVVVAAGHTRASAAELSRAVDAGLRFVTHVGNATDWPSRVYDSELRYRRSEPGVVGSFLSDERLSGSLILDGLHLDPRLAAAIIRLRGPDAVCLVSDATPATGLGPGRYRVGGLDATVHPEGHATAGEGLAGSMITLLDAVRSAIRLAGLPLETAVQMATLTPAHVAGAAARKGAIRVGADADLLSVSDEWDAEAVYVRGSLRTGTS